MVTIRQAAESDIKQICKLGQDVLEFSVNSETASFWPREIVQSIVSSSEAILLVAEEDMEIHGFIIANCNKAFKKVIIENIYVLPTARNSGIGEQLLSHLLFLAEKSKYEYVSTLIPIGSYGAAKLYSNSGFIKGEVFQWLDKSLSNNFKSN